MITKMTKYSFILLSGENEEFLNKVQELGVVDITRSAKPIDDNSAKMLDGAIDTQKAINKLKSIDFKKDGDLDKILEAKTSVVLESDLVLMTQTTVAELVELKTKINSTFKAYYSRNPWGDFDKTALDGLENKGYKVRYYCVSTSKFQADWAANWALEIISQDQKNVWFVTISPACVEYDFPAEECEAPVKSGKDTLVDIEALKTEEIQKKATLLILQEKVNEIEQAYNKQQAELELYLAKSSTELMADNLVSILEGYAPIEDEAKLCAEFDKLDVIYLHSEAVEEDNPPIKLKNNWFTRMFEVLTGIYGMPNYGEFDPTPIVAPFFLLFFSMCMGDAGYGILLFIIGLIMKAKVKSMASMGNLVATLGVGTTIVGFFLGTLFGIPLAEASWVPDGLKGVMITGEIAGYSAQMVLAIAIGVFHICLAMVVKAVGYTMRFGFKETISTWGWLTLILGGITIAGLTLIGALSSEATRWAVIALGVISGLGIFIFNTPGRNPLMNIGAGLWDTYNMVTGLLGDVLSYIRLYALGLAGGMLGNAFNDLGAMVLGDGGFAWIPFIIILIFGHALNLAMSCLGAFVHPLRLTFVEYFKNAGYEGKGTAYKPLKN